MLVVKTYKITVRPLSSSEQEIDFVHPKTQSRTRRKLKTDLITAHKIQMILEFIMGNDNDLSSRELVKQKLLEDDRFNSDLHKTWPMVEDLYYKSEEDQSGDLFDQIDYINSVLPIPEEYPKTILLGKFGVGKSTIIKKATCFNENIKFPFTDTSRTTTYMCEYILKDRSEWSFGFVVTFLSKEKTRNQIEYCIDRAVDTKIDLLFESLNNKGQESNDSDEDKVISSFISDPHNLFDIRCLFGSYYKTGSKLRLREDKKDQIDLWSNIYTRICNIVDEAINYSPEVISISDKHTGTKEFIKGKYYEYLYDARNNDFSNYTSLINFVLDRIKERMQGIYYLFSSSMAIRDAQPKWDDQNDWLLGFSCNIIDFHPSEFNYFIKPFTSREAKDFRTILTCLVSRMRIEVPYNDSLDQSVRNKPIVFIDTIGVSHSTDENNSIENSTNLNLDNIDVVTVVDDSTASMDSNTQNIIRHLADRILSDKLFIAYTHFDEFDKAEFIDDELEELDDHDESMSYYDEQKSDYLLNIQKNVISNIFRENRSEIYSFIINLATKTFFLKKLMHSSRHSYKSINNFIAKIQDYATDLKNHLIAEKINPAESIVEYDYKKLPLIFFKDIYTKYFEKERNEYLVAPPHHKTTEALTRRLSYGETYFYGARKLTPVDDFYSIVIGELMHFIMNPKAVNFTERISVPNHKEKLLGQLKEIIFEEIRKIINFEFTKPIRRKEWERLYLLCDIGSDYQRRTGIIEELGNIVPSMEKYIASSDQENWIDKLEDLFESSIKKLEDMIAHEKLKHRQ